MSTEVIGIKMVGVSPFKYMGLIGQSYVAVTVIHPHDHNSGKTHKKGKLQCCESHGVALEKTLAHIGVELFFSSGRQQVGEG